MANRGVALGRGFLQGFTAARERRDAQNKAQQQTDLLWLKSVLNHGKIDEGKFNEVLQAYRNVYPASDAAVELFKTQYGSAIDKTNKLTKLDQRAIKEIEINGKISPEAEAEYIQIFDGAKGAYEHTSTLYKFEGMDELADAEKTKSTAEAARAESRAPGGRLFAAEARKLEREGDAASRLAAKREKDVEGIKRGNAYKAIEKAFPVATGFGFTNRENSAKQLKGKKWIDFYMSAYPEWDAGTIADAASEMVAKELETGESPDPSTAPNVDPEVAERLQQLIDLQER